MYQFPGACLGVLTNITPDHLDRYDRCFQNYADSKMRIVQNMTSRDWFVYSGDDEVIRGSCQLPISGCASCRSPPKRRGERCRRRVSLRRKFTATAGKASVRSTPAKLRSRGCTTPTTPWPRPLATLAAGVAPAKIRKSLYAFAPVRHRLEPVAEKALACCGSTTRRPPTSIRSTALESMTRPVVWIAGGTDKGNDYEPLKAFARAKVHTLVCMGLDNAKLVREFTGVVPEVVSTDSLEAAMTASKAAARPGDAVLLSPACASFDLFRNYENRGELFKNWVEEKA